MSNWLARRVAKVGWVRAASIAANVATICLAIFFTWSIATTSSAREPKPPKEPIPLVGAATEGAITAPVAVIEYSDFECPFCGQFARNTLPELRERYVETNKIVLIFRYRPLEAIHKSAERAAEAAACAGKQNRFWQMHDLLFKNQAHLAPDDLLADAHTINLTVSLFQGCLDQQQTSKEVRDSSASADTLGLQGTPMFLIGRTTPGHTAIIYKVLDGAKPLADFEGAIEAGLDKRQ